MEEKTLSSTDNSASGELETGERTITRVDLTERILTALHANHITDETALASRETAARLLETVLGEIMLALEDGEQVKISGFGSFVLHNKAERIGRNPKTGVEAVISSRRSLSFRASNILRAAMNPGLQSGDAGADGDHDNDHDGEHDD